MLFPMLSNLDPALSATMKSRAGKNQQVSKLACWFRISASSGLVLESLPPKMSFENTYGNTTKSGRVGTDFAGNSVFAEGEDRAFRPSPVIESVSVTFGAGGLTRKCNFSIKCFTLPQAEKLAQYFLEPAYTCLIEYGYNTSESLGQKIKLSPCEIAKFNSYEYVKNKQKNSKYTYDGFMGYITGGGLKSGDGETFIIDCELTTIGEIPAYLQQHRGSGSTLTAQNKGGRKYNVADIQTVAERDTGSRSGKALFMQMYNRLPQAKQTDKVKALHTGVDDAGIPWSDIGNFVNMDDEIRKKMMEDLTNTKVESESGDAQIPEGAPLISAHSYIRLALAFEILNSYEVNLESKDSGCTDVSTFSYIIDYKNTICRAFPLIFSTDGSKLFIPNPKLPDFGLKEVLKSETKEDFNIIRASGYVKTIDASQKFEGKAHEFPQSIDLNSSNYKWPNDSVPYNIGARKWGYLKDLYINFEFFIEVLGRANYVTKDVYYEILNGLSTAANSIWHFEITQLPNPDKKGAYHLQIVDMNLCGNDSSTFEKCVKFRASGVDTPFLTSELSMDIPGAMKNMIVGKRNSNNLDTASEGNQPIKFNTLFAKKQDPVIKILDSFKEKETETPYVDPDDINGDKIVDADEARKANYELFMSKAVVVTNLKDREADMDAAEGSWYNVFNTADANIEDIAFVAAWNDVDLFRKLDLNSKGAGDANNILLPIQFSFTTFGISGIKTGDMFRIIDLPKQYTTSVFQVVEVSHELSNGLWQTSVVGKMRNTGG
jgi:hypothetical protein